MSTPFLDEVYARVDFDRELVFKFFTVFSLFEYALKRAGFARTGGSNEAQPDWDRFAISIHSRFNQNQTPELAVAVQYMLDRPVMKQVVEDRIIGFEPRARRPNQNDCVWLSVLIRGVRNNLVHGGKFRYDRPRDPDLIEYSLVILESWAQLHPDVEQELKYVQ